MKEILRYYMLTGKAVSSLTALALYLPIDDLLIPPSAYLTDRRKMRDIYVPYASGKRAFGVFNPLPLPSSEGSSPRLCRVLRETTTFVVMDSNIKIEGIFRVSPRAQIVEVLREAYDRGQKFIVWRDGEALATWPHHKEGYGDVGIKGDELDYLEGYDAHCAAALIKIWYKELREPVFPQSSYQALKRYYGDPNTPLEATTLLQILAPGVEYSPLTETARSILTTHLLPLLSRVAEHAEENKMTAFNLAVCFAPSLLSGPDPFEDIIMSTIIRRILTAMIASWKTDLTPALGLTGQTFEQNLRLPERVEDREDPLQESTNKRSSAEALDGQKSGIALLDNENGTSSSSSSESDDDDDDDDDDDENQSENRDRPPLPPRPQDATHSANHTNTTDTIRRKPAPPLRTPPRYSIIVSDQAAALARINGSRAGVPTDTVPEVPEDQRLETDTLPEYEERSVAREAQMADGEEGGMNIPRKPVGKGKKEGNGEGRKDAG